MEPDLNKLFEQLNSRVSFAHDLFLSYSSGQTTEASAIYGHLSEKMSVFYAPETLKSIEHEPGQYVEVLTQALMQSCQVMVLLSDSFLASSWCQLELYGYFNLFLQDPRRRLWIVPLTQGIDKEIAGQFVPLIHDENEAIKMVLDRYSVKELGTGDRFADNVPPKLFLDLPLYELYEPPGTGNRPPWGKDYRSPHGLPGAPPYAVYQQLVREYMVQLKRQGDDPFSSPEIELSIPMIGVDERYRFISKDARKDAMYLNSLGISPYSGKAKLNVRGMFAGAMQAHMRNEAITTETDCHEALGWLCLGHLDEGMEKMERAIQQGQDITGINFYITELARAKLISGDAEAALQTLGPIDTNYEAETLIRHAALARLGRLSDADREDIRNSKVSLDQIRFWSLLEVRQQLDYWIESLELAGYKG